MHGDALQDYRLHLLLVFRHRTHLLAKCDFSFNDLSSSSPDLGDDIGPLLRVMLLMGLLH